MQGPSVDIRNTTRNTRVRVPFKDIGEYILPASYHLSLVLCGDSLSRRMNSLYRKKNYSPNVLSFPYERDEGEIFINLKKAVREAKRFGIEPRDRIAHLFIHGCLHLLQWKHGDRMDAREQQVLRKFGFKAIVP